VIKRLCVFGVGLVSIVEYVRLVLVESVWCYAFLPFVLSSIVLLLLMKK